VSVPKHKINIAEDGFVVREIVDFSTGRRDHLTPLICQCKLDPLRRERMCYSDTHFDSLGNPAAMPFALFFGDGSCSAFHAGNPNLESFGSIQLRSSDAEWLFKWAGKHEVALEILGPDPMPRAVPA
jgi:hypothetical protein